MVEVTRGKYCTTIVLCGAVNNGMSVARARCIYLHIQSQAEHPYIAVHIDVVMHV